MDEYFPNNDGILKKSPHITVNTDMAPTGVNNFSGTESFLAHPNPVQNRLTLALPKFSSILHTDLQSFDGKVLNRKVVSFNEIFFANH